MEVVEWLEFIGRISDLKFKGYDMDRSPLVEKIYLVLDDLFQGFGYIRKEIEVHVEEFSESDDDY